MRKFIFIIAIIGLFSSCKRQKCLKPTGKEITIEKTIPEFDALEIQSKIAPTIVIDTVNYVKITGGEYLVDFISFDLNGNKLLIHNRNECNFFRSYKKKVKIELHCKPFSEFLWRGSEPVDFQGTLTGDKFHLQLDEGSYQVKLNVDVNYISVSNPSGSGKFYLSGETNIMNINNASNCSGDTRNLQVNESIYIENYSPGSVFLNADCPILNCSIFGSGNVKYIGNPITIESNIYGTGALIDSN